MKTAARSDLATVTATLVAAGFKSHVPTGRGRRPGFTVRGRSQLMPALCVFDYCAPGEFAKVCATLRTRAWIRTAANGDR